MDGLKEFWPQLADEAAYILDLLASNPDSDDTMLLIVALGRIEKLLNPKRLPFSDQQRQSYGGDAELCRGWRKIRGIVDALIAALHLEPICEGQTMGWNAASESELPSLPPPVPRNWIESLNNGVRIIRQRLQQYEVVTERAKDKLTAGRWNDLRKAVPQLAEQIRWLRAAQFNLYKDLFEWFGPAMLEAGHGLSADESPAVCEVWLRGHEAWTALTNLPKLDSHETWLTAGVAAGIPPGEVSAVDRRALVQRIRLWALARPAMLPPNRPTASTFDDEDERRFFHSDPVNGMKPVGLPEEAAKHLDFLGIVEDWWNEAKAHVDDYDQNPDYLPQLSDHFESNSNVVANWCEDNTRINADPIHDLHRQIRAIRDPGPPWGPKPTPATLLETAAKCRVIIDRVNRVFDRVFTAATDQTPIEPKGITPADPAVSQPTPALMTTDAMQRLLRVYAGNVADERFNKAASVLTSSANANEKLAAMDRELKIPPTTSAETLGEVLGVTKQAVMKTDWWNKNRRGKQNERVETRRARLAENGQRFESAGDEN